MIYLYYNYCIYICVYIYIYVYTYMYTCIILYIICIIHSIPQNQPLLGVIFVSLNNGLGVSTFLPSRGSCASSSAMVSSTVTERAEHWFPTQRGWAERVVAPRFCTPGANRISSIYTYIYIWCLRRDESKNWWLYDGYIMIYHDIHLYIYIYISIQWMLDIIIYHIYI